MPVAGGVLKIKQLTDATLANCHIMKEGDLMKRYRHILFFLQVYVIVAILAVNAQAALKSVGPVDPVPRTPQGAF